MWSSELWSDGMWNTLAEHLSLSCITCLMLWVHEMQCKNWLLLRCKATWWSLSFSYTWRCVKQNEKNYYDSFLSWPKYIFSFIFQNLSFLVWKLSLTFRSSQMISINVAVWFHGSVCWWHEVALCLLWASFWILEAYLLVLQCRNLPLFF